MLSTFGRQIPNKSRILISSDLSVVKDKTRIRTDADEKIQIRKCGWG